MIRKARGIRLVVNTFWKIDSQSSNYQRVHLV